MVFINDSFILFLKSFSTNIDIFLAGYPQNQFNMQGSQQISPGGNPHGVKRPRAE